MGVESRPLPLPPGRVHPTALAQLPPAQAQGIIDYQTRVNPPPARPLPLPPPQRPPPPAARPLPLPPPQRPLPAPPLPMPSVYPPPFSRPLPVPPPAAKEYPPPFSRPLPVPPPAAKEYPPPFSRPLPVPPPATKEYPPPFSRPLPVPPPPPVAETKPRPEIQIIRMPPGGGGGQGRLPYYAPPRILPVPVAPPPPAPAPPRAQPARVPPRAQAAPVAPPPPRARPPPPPVPPPPPPPPEAPIHFQPELPPENSVQETLRQALPAAHQVQVEDASDRPWESRPQLKKVHSWIEKNAVKHMQSYFRKYLQQKNHRVRFGPTEHGIYEWRVDDYTGAGFRLSLDFRYFLLQITCDYDPKHVLFSDRPSRWWVIQNEPPFYHHPQGVKGTHIKPALESWRDLSPEIAPCFDAMYAAGCFLDYKRYKWERRLTLVVDAMEKAQQVKHACCRWFLNCREKPIESQKDPRHPNFVASIPPADPRSDDESEEDEDD